MTKEQNTEVVDAVARWLALSIDGAAKRKSTVSPAELSEKVGRWLKQGAKTGFVDVLCIDGKPAAIFLLMRAIAPRIRGDHHLFFLYDPRRAEVGRRWIVRRLVESRRRFPRHLSAGAAPKEDAWLGPTLRRLGFRVSYDILAGEVSPALRQLRRRKRPSRDLAHCGLELRKLRTPDLREMMRLQRRVALLQPEHTYYSYTKQQLRLDEREYREAMRKGTGLILGVFERAGLRGFMTGTIHEMVGSRQKCGGISFFLHPDIQGRGVAKTGYLLLLEFLQKNKVREFRGGTSQPAVKGLAKIMGRRVIQKMYLRSEK